MKKIIISSVAILVLLSVVYAYLYINGTYNDKSTVSKSVNSETLTESRSTTILEENMQNSSPTNAIAKVIDTKNITSISRGEFIKIDPAHYASGDVNVSFDGSSYIIDLGSNFSSADGPDLFVYLSAKQDYKNIAVGGVDTSKTLNIGVLKSINGKQTYRVSKEEFEKYNDAIIIWCKKFGVQFSRADLR